jgi:integrase
MAKLTMEHIQQREGRWVIVDMIGKGNRTRTITVHPTAKYLLDDWTQAVGITSGLLFRAINKWDNLAGERDIRKDKKADGFLTDQAIADMVKKYGAKCGFPKLAPHDLRRTGARLAYDAGGSIEQIQLQLGHANLKTTQDYLNIKLDYRDAPGDKIRLKIKMI